MARLIRVRFLDITHGDFVALNDISQRGNLHDRALVVGDLNLEPTKFVMKRIFWRQNFDFGEIWKLTKLVNFEILNHSENRNFKFEILNPSTQNLNLDKMFIKNSEI